MVIYKIRDQMSKAATKENPEKTADIFMDPNTFDDGSNLEMDSLTWAESGNYLIYSITKKGSDW